MANCSSSATGAVLWLMPTARRLMSPPRWRSSAAFAGSPCPWRNSQARSRGLTHQPLLAQEREYLELHGEVDLADVDARGSGERHRREVQDAADPGGGHAVADRLRHLGRGRDDADGGARGGDDLLQLVERAHGV